MYTIEYTTMKEIKTYQIKNLVRRITNTNQPNNASFTYYGFHVSLQSGLNDYVSAWVKDPDDSCTILEFSIDFLTKKLYVQFAMSDKTKTDLINAVKSLYGKSLSVSTNE